MNRMLAAFLPALAVFCAMRIEAKDRVKAASANSGSDMYRTYCASCHGLAGKGDGPAAPAMKTRPSDLTRLARRNGGRFPEVRVYQTVEGEAAFPAHGSREMPVWGTAFRQMGGTDVAQVKLRVRNLTRFVGSLQTK